MRDKMKEKEEMEDEVYERFGKFRMVKRDRRVAHEGDEDYLIRKQIEPEGSLDSLHIRWIPKETDPDP